TWSRAASRACSSTRRLRSAPSARVSGRRSRSPHSARAIRWSRWWRGQSISAWLRASKAGHTFGLLVWRATGRKTGSPLLLVALSRRCLMTAPLAIDVVSDVVCPWCFIGKSRLEQALELRPDIAVEIHWRPYFLNDWVPREGISRDEYLTKKFGSPERYKSIAGRVAQAAKAEGLIYNVDKIARQPNTLDCHRLILWARNTGASGRMKQRLMELYFTE